MAEYGLTEAKFHTKQKHAFLDAYLNIWIENVGKKSPSVPSLEIFDLYASYGRCYCDENKEEWDGSALISAKCLKNYPRPKTLWLNSYSEDNEEKEHQHKSLQYYLSQLELPESFEVIISGEPILDNINRALRHCDPKFPSNWILDPYSPAQLPWKIVENIALHEGTYQTSDGTAVTRRPELFINLLTSYLARFSAIDDQKHIVDEALGLPREEWEDILSGYKENGIDLQTAILEIYSHRLAEIYGKYPIAWKVVGTEGNIVYTFLLITESNAGYHVMRLKGKHDMMEWFNHDWTQKAKELKAKRSIQRKASKSSKVALFLSDFEENSE